MTIWSLPLAVLFAIWLWLVFSSGASEAIHWLPGVLALGVFALLAALKVVYPRRPRQLSLLVLILFALYTAWVAVSALWAGSLGSVWLEATRTSGLLLFFALALVYLTGAWNRRVFRYLLMASALVLLVACVWRLWSANMPAALFVGNRLAFPTGYPNGSAALFLIGFWPLVWLAAAPDEPAPVRGIALGLATGLLGLAIMTGSRAAVYSLALTTVVAFVLSPIRLRTLLYLIVPGLLLVYEFPNINRYWLEGADAVAGGVGARTVVVATLAAAFMGMIVALLERWIPASRRMKVIFGTVVLTGALAGLIYGSIVLTADTGGPGAWFTRAWHQFTSEEEIVPEKEPGSRLTVITTSGGMSIWDTAWRTFESEPVLGVGAGNFVFHYDRLRATDRPNPGSAHSLGLPVLAETGVVGGGLMVLATLLSLGGMLWGRWASAWLRARQHWLHLPGREPMAPGGSRFCNARWGDDPQSYGWDAAMLTGLCYWFVHAGIDRLWLTTAAVLPALLLLAAGLSNVDARVGVLWPRLESRLRIRRERPVTAVDGDLSAAPDLSGPQSDNAREGAFTGGDSDGSGPAGDFDDSMPATPVPEPRVRRYTGPEPVQVELFGERRSDQYASKWKRRGRRRRRRNRSASRLQPAGSLSVTFRWVLLGVSVLAILVAAFPYASLQVQRSATAVSITDGRQAVFRAKIAHRLHMLDPQPFAIQGGVYARAATTVAATEAADRVSAVLDDLTLALAAYERAANIEPSDWTRQYQAGIAGLNLLVVMSLYTGSLVGIAAVDDPSQLSSLPGLEDWATLAGAEAVVGIPGAAAGSLWPAGDPPQAALRYRDMRTAQLREVTLSFLKAAAERNPLADEVQHAIDLACTF